MEIIGKIAFKRNKKERAKKTWLTIGLISFVLTMICEVILGNLAFLALIVPFLYLLNLRNKMGRSVLYKDVAIFIENEESGQKIEISNCEYLDNILYSVRFSIMKDSDVSVFYFIQKEKLKINCIAKKVLFLESTIVPIFEKQPCGIEIYVSIDDAKKVASELKCFLNMR